MISTGHTTAEAGVLPAGMPEGGSLAVGLDFGSVTRAQIEDFLYREARLLDDWDLDTWLTLWAEEDTRYVVPCNDDPDGDPARDLVLIDDDRLRMRLRVERLNSRKAHREYPHSRTNHQVSNVVVGTVEGSGADAELLVTAAFTVWRFRNGKASYYVGRYHYRLISAGGELRIRSKRSVLDMTELRPAGDLAILL
jgi:p-cumate 2,3-dioxygenase subunit beta